jgi:succinate dehydrogenase (ubiquinone) membrane anchor subunit
MSLLRFAGAQLASSSFGSGLLVRAVPAASTVVPSKTFSLSQPARIRLYGPEAEHEKVDELHHWKRERFVAIALLPIIPTALMFPNVALDTTLCTAMVLHSHWRLSGVAEDYIHGQVLPRIAQPLVLILSICAFGSLCYLNFYDVGFANAVRTLYTQL